MAREQLPNLRVRVSKYSNDDLRTIWLRALPHLANRNAAETSPYWQEVHDLISAEWARREILDQRNGDYFKWPSTDAPGGRGSIGRVDWFEEGMLSFLGYRVGTSQGLQEPARWFILRHTFSRQLPPINGPAYMAGWGKPASSSRLEKLANELAAFARNGKRLGNRAVAVSHWETDLRFLYREYYVGRFGFGWPDTSF